MFTGDSLYLFVKSFVLVIFGVFIWIVGYLVFLKFEGWHVAVKKYFILLTILASFPLVHSIWENSFSSNRKIHQSICNKSSDNGMFCSIDRITVEEYMYLSDKSGWLPLIPSSAESIIIDYYRDDFLGDYWFSMWVEIPTGSKFDSIQFPHLKKVSMEEKNGETFDGVPSTYPPFGENTYYYSIASGE